jgi:hypothetical protein
MLIDGPLNLAPSTIDFRVSSGVGALPAGSMLHRPAVSRSAAQALRPISQQKRLRPLQLS